MAQKRYYWLKLKEDFFNDIRMKRLRKISAGSTYTIIYLKLLLLSLKDEGKLYFEKVDDTFIQELSLIIDETEDDIMLTLQYLQKVGLLEVISEDEYFLTELPSLIGSETDWAAKKRKYREQQKINASRTMSLECHKEVRQEKEIDKDIDIELDKDKEGELEEVTSPIFYGEFQNISLTSDEYNSLKDKLQEHMQMMIDKLSRYIESTGKKYQSHYATILNWYEQDKDKLSNKVDAKAISTDYEDSKSL